MGNVLRLIISSLIILVEGLILGHMGYGIINWEYWMILVLTMCCVLVNVFVE